MKNKKTQNEYLKKWKREHPKLVIQQNRRYRENHRKKLALNARKKYEENRLQMIKLLGGKCIKCGFSDKRALQIDHINGGGSKSHSLEKGAYYFNILKKILEGSSNYQLLCANCNWIKKHEQKEHVPRKYLDTKSK